MNSTTIDENAPVIARHALFIAAPLETLWSLHTDIDRWPTWQGSIDTAHLDGRFVPGATFAWSTFGMHIVSSVFQVEPMRHTLWGGPSDGIVGLHSWTFTPETGGIMVSTEESWSGPRSRPTRQSSSSRSTGRWPPGCDSSKTPPSVPKRDPSPRPGTRSLKAHEPNLRDAHRHNRLWPHRQHTPAPSLATFADTITAGAAAP